MEAFDSISRVDDAADRLGVLKVGRELFPVVLLGVDDQGVLFLPLGRELQQGLFS